MVVWGNTEPEGRDVLRGTHVIKLNQGWEEIQSIVGTAAWR